MIDNDIRKVVVCNIKKYRKIKGLSQERLAEKCNTSTSYIGLLETNKKNPRLETIEKIANALDIDFILLFQKDSDKDKVKIDPELKEKIFDEIKIVIDKNI